MEIAILGAGYAGLATAISLKSLDSSLNVTVFHDEPLDKSCSSISTGLLQPFVGKYIKKSIWADQCMVEALELLDLSKEALGQQVYEKTGVLRVAYKPFQVSVSKRVIKKHPENKWFEKGYHPDIPFPCLFMPSGVTVYSDLYIEGLVKACLEKGVKFEQKKITDTQKLYRYDKIILCVGHRLKDFEEGKNLPVEKIKGQALIVKLPRGINPFPIIISKGHISLCKDKRYCQIGSTYERDYDSVDPDSESDRLIDQIAEFFPKIVDCEVVEKKAGIRLSKIGEYKPYCFQASDKVWVIGALGSRGLLYHAFLAKKLAKTLLKGEKLLPELLPSV